MAISALKGALHDDSVAEMVYRSLLKLGVKVKRIGEPPGPYRYKIINKEE